MSNKPVLSMIILWREPEGPSGSAVFGCTWRLCSVGYCVGECSGGGSGLCCILGLLLSAWIEGCSVCLRESGLFSLLR